MKEPDPGALGRARAAAARVRASGLIQTPAGDLLEPVPIHTPDGGEIAGWFVGLGVGPLLAGFLQLAADLAFRRYASFQRHPPALEGCPRRDDWLDPLRILERARSRAADDERLADPFLTYDENPDRLAWAVRATDPAGREGTIYVAGDFAYRAAPSGGFGGAQA
jgi:hypothetical protein